MSAGAEQVVADKPVEVAKAKALTYAIVTPARNEAASIEKTICSVVDQVLLPLRWIIVSDGSTDATDEIVSRYARQHDWIRLLTLPQHAERHFAAKVNALRAGYQSLQDLDFDVICNLDADITFGNDYFAFLMGKFSANPKLGVAGTPFCEHGSTYDFRFSSVEHVSGACQCFRKTCFEQIGGYVPVKTGGVDVIAVLKARMNGWQARTFTEKVCEHHRPMGTAASNEIGARFKLGKKDYALGNSKLWQLFRCVYQMRYRPFVIGGVALIAGYVWCLLSRSERSVSNEMMRFRRQEQHQRLRDFFLGRRSSGENNAV